MHWKSSPRPSENSRAPILRTGLEPVDWEVVVPELKRVYVRADEATERREKARPSRT